MNRKLIKASVAGIAAIAVGAGGTTFAAWSDFVLNEDNNIGADILALDVGASGTSVFDSVTMYPGGSAEREYVVASRDGNAVPEASLKLALESLVSEENGCASNSEPVVDADCATNSEGEFDDEALLVLNVTQPTTDIANACSQPAGSALSFNGLGGSSVPLKDVVAATAVQPLNLLNNGDSLEAGEGICVKLAVSLPTSATNATQGDEVTFDIRYLLNQCARATSLTVPNPNPCINL